MPNKFSKTSFNIPKLLALPFHQTNSSSAAILFDLEFIETKVEAGMGEDLLLDYNLAISHFSNPADSASSDKSHGIVAKLGQFLQFVKRNMPLMRSNPQQVLMMGLNEQNDSPVYVEANFQKNKQVYTGRVSFLSSKYQRLVNTFLFILTISHFLYLN